MKTMKKFLSWMLALMLVLSLCACGQTNQPASTEPSDSIPATEPSQPTEEVTEPTLGEGMAQYKVKVEDEAGNPVVGVMVQVCTDETCLIPVKTDDTGLATFAPAQIAEYHANFLPGIPEGYTAEAEVFYFGEGETELTIVLQTVSAE